MDGNGLPARGCGAPGRRCKVRTKGRRTFVGFGFGAIQAGLFLYEAHRSGQFERLIVAEVLSDRVDAVRRADGCYGLNIAHADGIEQTQVGPVDMYNPMAPADRVQLIEAIAQAEEMATAIPSVQGYVTSRPDSLHRVLAAGLRAKVRQGGPRAVIYTAENHPHAASLLEEAVFEEIPEKEWDVVHTQVRFLNTVIGKMSGVKTDPAEIQALNLRPMVADMPIAFLVEAFNHILISRIDFGTQPFLRGMDVFEEKQDLQPFEEAKLYGHNAVHALAAYLGWVRGHALIADIRHDEELMGWLRTAFIDESGKALVRKHAGVDPLFTPEGYAAYADDLLVRMTNPWLRDTVERVGRDPARKLGWEDRLVGTMRLALAQEIRPQHFAMGAAAALRWLGLPPFADANAIQDRLSTIWRASTPDEGEMKRISAWISWAFSSLPFIHSQH